MADRLTVTEGICPECRAAVIYIGLTAFDLVPEPRYVLDDSGPRIRPTYTSHFDTCIFRVTARSLAETRNRAAPR